MALAVASGCVRTPTGHWRFTLYSQHAVEEEARHWHVSAPEIADPELIASVDRVAARVGDASHEPGRDFEVRVLDFFEPMALSFGDGRVYVSKGLLLQLDSEAELAFLLGHEIAHVTAQHGRSAMSRHRLLYLLAFPILPLAGPPERMRDELSKWVQPAYSRGQEVEADEIGARYAVAAGYPGGCAVRMMEKLARIDEIEGGDYGARSTHPEATRRLERLRERYPSHGDCDDGYLALLDGVQTDQSSMRAPPGTLYVGGLSAAVASDGLVRSHTGPGRAELVYESPRLKVDIERYSSGRDITWARAQVEGGSRERVRGEASERARSQAPSGERPSTSLTFERAGRDGPVIERLQWVEIAGRLYHFKGSAAGEDWGLAEPMLDAVVDSFRIVTAEERRAWMAAIRMRFHVVEPGETLEDVRDRYAAWDLAELRTVNLLADDQELEAGMRLRVGLREPLHADGDADAD
jgi:predicted Zn-dependent protease